MADDSFARLEFADNPEIRCPVVLCFDTSASMTGMPIEELNAGLRLLADAWKTDHLASKRVEVALVVFGGGVRALDLRSGSGGVIGSDAAEAFVTADYLNVPFLTAAGDTPMGEAVRAALWLLADRKALYKSVGVDYFRPQLYLFTDGQPTDPDWEASAQALRDEEERRGVSVWPFGVEGADMAKLARFARRPPVRIPNSAGEFQKLFEWLSKSVAAVARSQPGDRQVAAPELASSWNVMEL
jgi:uncharacterized protein YegL